MSALQTDWSKMNRVIHKKTGHKVSFHRHNENTLSIDTYAYSSKLQHINPSFKLLFCVSLIILGLVSDSIGVCVILILSMAWLIVIKGKLSLASYLSLLAIPLLFIILSGIGLLINISKEPHPEFCINVKFFYIYTDKESMYNTILVTFKAFASVSCLYMLSLTTPFYEIIDALRSFKLPKIICELMSVIYRFIFILLDLHNKMRLSAKSRLGFTGFKRALFTFGNILSSLLVVSLKKTNVYYDALEARGYTGEIKFLTHKKPLRLKHVVYAVMYYVFLILVIFLTDICR